MGLGITPKCNCEMPNLSGRYAPCTKVTEIPIVPCRPPAAPYSKPPPGSHSAPAGASSKGCTCAWPRSPWAGRSHDLKLSTASAAPVEHSVAASPTGVSAVELEPRKKLGLASSSRHLWRDKCRLSLDLQKRGAGTSRLVGKTYVSYAPDPVRWRRHRRPDGQHRARPI